MNRESEKVAGWLSLVAALALVPEAVILYGYDAGSWASVPVLAIASSVMLVRITCAAIALVNFGRLLNDAHNFFRLDRVIPLLIAGSIAMWIVATAVRLPSLAMDARSAAIALVLTGVPLGVVSVLLGWRVLQVESELVGYKKPFGWTCILGPVCFLSVVAIPLGLLMMAASSVFLGLMLLSSREAVPEFV